MNTIREQGIDLMRIFAMLGIVVIHTLGHGGILNNLQSNTINYQILWLLEIIFFVAVDLFALITGYVYYNESKKIRYAISTFINLWLQVVFYGISILLILKYSFNMNVGKQDLFKMLFPITNNMYWYFIAYTGMIFIAPIVSLSLKKIEKRHAAIITIILIVLFSFVDTLSKGFGINNGYSVFWLLILFILGSLLKKYEIHKFKFKFYLPIISFILIILTWSWKLYGFKYQIGNISITPDTLLSYNSPTILLYAITLLIIGSTIKINSKLISFITPNLFAVYLINDHEYFRNFFIKNKFIPLAYESPLYGVSIILLFSICFLFSCIFIDKFRSLLFKITGIKKILNKIKKIDLYIEK